MNQTISEAITEYCRAHSLTEWAPKAALIDMDGVLYDSMPGHARAWKWLMDQVGIPCTEEEFFLYEGMTGYATIQMLAAERLGHELDPAEARALYARKGAYFHAQNPRRPMPGAARMLRTLEEHGLKRVLVTGSAQQTLLDSLAHDYPGAFLPGMMVTALDVTKGKPDPQPYLMGQKKADLPATSCIVVENAPLGCRAGRASGSFVVGLTTGPMNADVLKKAGAHIVFPSMEAFADQLPEILR